MPLLTLDNISLRFADKVILENANATIHKGNKIALIGRNGEGKSTLMKILAGQIGVDDGRLNIKTGTSITRLEQNPPLNDNRLVFDVIASGFGAVGELLTQYQHALDEADMALVSQTQSKIDACNAWQFLPKINAYIDQFELEPNKKLSELSGGWRRRVLLVASIISQPSILLLDEPTNHMDIKAILQLEKLLMNYTGTLILVSHDRAFVKNVVNRVFDLDRGYLSVFDCGYDAYIRRKDEQLNAESQAQRRFEKRLSQEEVWIRQGIKARRTRNEGRVRALEGMRKIQMQKRAKTGKIQLHNPQDNNHQSKIVFEVKKLGFEIDNKCLLKDFSSLILKGDKIGIVGGNGTGKSSFIKLLLGQLEATSGHIRCAKTIELAYFDQLRESLDPHLIAMDFVSGGKERIQVGDKEPHIIGYLKSFLFTAEQARSPIMMCSGGEQNRLLLAKVLAQPANLLVLDEPSNDLDVETLELLEEMLSNYQGTLLLISHDREFINNIVTSTLVFEGDGKLQAYAGGYDDYLMQKQENLNSKNSKNHSNIKDKKTSNTTKQKLTNSPTKTSHTAAKKLSYKQQQLLKSLPKRIEQTEAKVGTIRGQISDANFYENPNNDVQAILRELANLEEKLELLYEQWAELE